MNESTREHCPFNKFAQQCLDCGDGVYCLRPPALESTEGLMAAARVLHDEATPGTWEISGGGYPFKVVREKGFLIADNIDKKYTARFIAAAHKLIPLLVDVVDRLREANRKSAEAYTKEYEESRYKISSLQNEIRILKHEREAIVKSLIERMDEAHAAVSDLSEIDICYYCAYCTSEDCSRENGECVCEEIRFFQWRGPKKETEQ